ncbi:hypothetical protein ABZ816_27645 [Actinosynnema sp. NPDC047251]|uniref:hypothetical protein n=1 Tax=Saccharothrix espanaensis TaxID=103731 RepID=UPI0002D5100C|nr:hypothetical protein [Saccharothrix espanaensis]
MEHALKGYLDGRLAPAQFAIRYVIQGPSGTTEARFAGTGEYRLSSTVTADHRPRSFIGRMGPHDVRELALVALRAGLWRAAHVGSVDGGAETRIDVTAGEQTFSVVLWTSETAEVRSFDQVQQRILRLVHRLTGGAVQEVGR